MEEFVINILNRFNRPIKPVINYKTIYEYNGKKYNLNTIDYIYLFLNSISIFSSENQKYSLIIHSIYSDIFKNKTDNYKNYSGEIQLKYLKNDNNFKITKQKDEFKIYDRYNKFSEKFIDIFWNILDSLVKNKNMKIYTMSCVIDYNECFHSELIFFQIYNGDFYIINYDPEGKDDINITNIFMNYLKLFYENNFQFMKINVNVKLIYKEQLEFKYENKNIGGMQLLTDNFSFLSKTTKPNQGICLIYSMFMCYFLFNVLYFYNNGPCYQAIINIEYILNNIFIKNKQEFANIFINFANHILNSYYEFSVLQIENSYGYYEKIDFQNKIINQFEILFENFIDEIYPKKLKKYIEKELNNEYKKSSGYQCKKDLECKSNNCIDNICYIDEKEVHSEDIRSIGNPCLYNIQCRSRTCKNNICIGEDNQERDKNPQYYEDEIFEHESNQEILDEENLNIYENM